MNTTSAITEISTTTNTTTTTTTTTTTNSTTNNSTQIPEGCVVLLKSTQGDFLPWDNPHNLISREVEQSLDAAVAVGFLPVLFLISLLTNLINLAVFWRQGLKERINLCLFSLSFTDLLYMIYSFIFNLDRMRQETTRSTLHTGPVFKFIMNNLLESLRALNWVSGFISTMIACERCFCVLSPLRSQTILKTKTTVVIIVVSYFVILAGPVAAAKRWKFICIYDPVTNSTSETLYTSEFYLENKQILDFVTLMFGTVQPMIYLLVVFVTTVVTSVKLRKMATWREQTSSATLTSREIALTRMLIGVSCGLRHLFLTSSLILGICIAFVPDVSLHGRHYNFFNFMISLFELFTYINSSFNFFVYCFLGSKYKATLRELCGCRNKRASRGKVVGEMSREVKAAVVVVRP